MNGLHVRIGQLLVPNNEIEMEGHWQDNDVLGLISSFVGSSSLSNPETKQLQESNVLVVSESHSLKNDILHKKDCTKFKVIVCTKDRPWQLQQLLYSMKLEQMDIPITISIICHVSATSKHEFNHGYDQVREEFKNINGIYLQWMYETNSHDDNSCSFASLLEQALLLENTEPSSGCSSLCKDDDAVVMFLTDDCILLKPLQQLMLVARENLYKGDTIAFCSRLHPGMTFSQTRNQTCPPPIRHMQFYQCDIEWKTTNAITYPIDQATMEFAYPFDLSGGVYLQSVVRNIMNDIRLQKLVGSYTHPNYFEINGNIAISKYTHGKLLSIPTTPSLVILAINRVQNICCAPLATTKDESWTSDALLSFLGEKKMIDIEKYQRCWYNTSHIGDSFLRMNEDTSHSIDSRSIDSRKDPCQDNKNDFYKVSVLIPVHTGPSKPASLAIQSIMYESMTDESALLLLLLPMQIVIVDDRCVDGSIDAMIQQAIMFGISAEVDTQIFDFRCKESTNPLRTETDRCIHIYLYKCSKSGLGPALNHGLKHCKSEFVARLDADDISCPFRLHHQISVLKQDLQTNVIGTNMVLFSDHELSSPYTMEYNGSLILPYDLSKRYGILSTSIQPSEAGFVDWAMMFSCVLSHPTVMFRKSFILNNGGYTEEPCFTEDYELWLRLQQHHAKCMKSLPMIGLCHRKHKSRSNSDVRKVQQRNESIQLSYSAIMEYIGCSTNKHSIRHVQVLKFPHEMTDLDTLNGSVEMLVDLEMSFLQKHQDILTTNEISLIRHDCTERIGELVTLGIEKFGRDVSKGFAWYVWSERDPNRQLERVTLLLSCT